MKKFISLFLFIFFAKSLFSQTEKIVNFEFGVGSFANFEKSTGFSFGAAGNLAKENNLYTFRYIRNIEFILFTNPENELIDFGFLYGKIFRSEYFAFSASLGLGFVSGKKRTDKMTNQPPSSGLISTTNYNSEKIFGIAAPCEANLDFIGLKHFGIGVKCFGNVNIDFPVMGFLCSLKLGNLK